MSERTSYAPGIPCWVDLGSPDVEAAAGFYSGLFGWEAPELPNSAEMGGYRRATKDGVDVAGMMPLMQEGQPPAWSSYVSVADADATAAAVKEAGGSVIAEPMDVAGLGRMAVFADPTGAVFGIWQPGTFAGAGRVNEPGALAWNELGTRDVDAAKAFYSAVFGWEIEDHEMGEMGTYTEWLVYFAVENTDAAVETVKSSGGGVSFGPIDIPAGRFAIVTDPHGAAFAVIQQPDEAAV